VTRAYAYLMRSGIAERLETPSRRFWSGMRAHF